MKPGGSGRKGNAFRRSVAFAFTEAYYPDGDGEFRKTPDVGDWDKKVAPGDIIAFRYVDKEKKDMEIDRTFPFSIECKHWATGGLKHFFSGLYSAESAMFSWMEQSWGEATPSGRIPIVVFRLFRTKDVIVLSSWDFADIISVFGNFTGKIYTIEKIMPREQKSHKKKAIPTHQKFVFILLEGFLDWIDWEVYKKDLIK